jgi:hypothetical protein
METQITNGFQYANWSSTAAKTKRLQPFCSNNPFHGRASTVHHLKYRRSLFRRILGLFLLHKPCKSVAGREIPGYDVVTVCDHCHANNYGHGLHGRSLHHKSVWIKVKLNTLNNHQIWWKAWELRIKFWVIAIVLRLWHRRINLKVN